MVPGVGSGWLRRTSAPRRFLQRSTTDSGRNPRHNEDMKPFIAFDLGNVLLPFEHMKACRALARLYATAAKAVHEQVFAAGCYCFTNT